jgi:anti-anti-sigma factor
MRTHIDGDQIVFELAGELDIATCPPVMDALATALEHEGARDVVFDLRDVTFMDSSALKCLLYAHNRVGPRGGTVVVRNARPQVAKVIRLVGLDQTVQVHAASPAPPAQRMQPA